jgi:hypothetical protein
MKSDNFVNSLDFLKILFKLAVIWLKDFEKHVVKIILAKLLHL